MPTYPQDLPLLGKTAMAVSRITKGQTKAVKHASGPVLEEHMVSDVKLWPRLTV